MSKQFNYLAYTCLALVITYGCSSQTLASKDSDPQITSNTSSNKAGANDLLVVDCLLPGQIRKLGTSHTFISPRQPIRTTAVDCEIRGGEYVSYDRADYRTALNVWLDPAKQGDAKAQVYVGEIFEKGLGTEPDYIQAAAWYRKAALQGDSRGAINLGYLYEKGLGVEKNTIEALNWYRKASGLEDDDLQFASTIEASNEEQLGQLREELSQSQSELAALRSQLRNKEQQLQRKQSSLYSSEQSLEELKRELDRRRSLTAGSSSGQISALQAELLEQQASVARQRQENALLKSRLDQQQSQLEGELEASRQQRQQLEQDMAAQQRAELNRLSEELDKSRQQLAAARQELEESNAQLLAEQRKASQTKQQLLTTTSEKQNSVQDLQLEIERREAVIQQLQTDQARELEMAGSVNQALQQDLERQRTELESLREQHHSAEQQLAAALKQLDDLNSQLKLEQEKSNQAQQLLTSTASEKQDLVLQLQTEIKQQEASMAQLQASLTRELEKAGSNQEKLQQDLAQQREEAEALSSQYKQSQENLAVAEANLAKLNAQLADEQDKSKQVQQALAESSSSNSAEIQRLEDEVKRREAELNTQRDQIASLESELSTQKEKLAGIQAEKNMVALQGPSIEILDPPITLTRGVPSVQLRSVMKERTIVGTVKAPSGLLTLSVNDRSQTTDEFGVFRTAIPVEDRQTLVNVVAVDKKGKSAAVNFELIPKLRQVSAPPPAIEKTTPGQSLRNYPVDFGNYHALIIGNNNYANFPDLNSAINDARMADKILREKYGFKTTLVIDADRYSVLSNLNKLRETLTEDDNLLIYYAGHGELDQINQRGHWLPIDAEPNSTANWISNVDVTDILNAISARHILVVADSCYSGTMTRSALARLESGMSNETRIKWFKVMAKTRSRSVLTSGGLKPVLDSGSGDHSVFANAFFQVLQENNDVLEGYKVYRQVSDQVRVAAARYNLEQTPQYAPILHGGHEAGEFFFVPKSVKTAEATSEFLKLALQNQP